MILSVWLCLLSSIPLASAGSGPWTLSPGDVDVYVGAESRRTTRLVDSAGTTSPLPGGGVSTIGAVGVASVGILPRLEGALLIPAYRSRSLSSGDAACAALGLDACRTSSGVGVVSMRLKGLLLDELYGAPLSVSLAGELRLGDLTAPTRARLTALGDGTTDLGVFLSTGRSGGLGGGGIWSAFAEGGYRYRFANSTVDGIDVPGNEWLGAVEALVGPSPRWLLGPVGYVLHRPDGFALESDTFLVAGAERFVGLRTSNVQAGGKVILRSSAQWSVALSALRTLQARDSFGDELVISAGLSFWQPAPTAILDPGGT